jgi:hypothetical protein
MTAALEFRPRKRIENHRLPTETEQHSTAPHWVAYSRGLTWLLAGFGLWALLFATGAGPWGAVPVLLVLLRGGYHLAQTYEDRFVITDKRIYRIRGVFNQHFAAMPLTRIVDVTLEEPVWGRLPGRSNYGHLIFENAAQDQGLRELRYVPEAARLNRMIQELVHTKPESPRVGGGGLGASGVVSSPECDRTGEIPRVT